MHYSSLFIFSFDIYFVSYCCSRPRNVRCHSIWIFLRYRCHAHPCPKIPFPMTLWLIRYSRYFQQRFALIIPNKRHVWLDYHGVHGHVPRNGSHCCERYHKIISIHRKYSMCPRHRLLCRMYGQQSLDERQHWFPMHFQSINRQQCSLLENMNGISVLVKWIPNMRINILNLTCLRHNYGFLGLGRHRPYLAWVEFDLLPSLPLWCMDHLQCKSKKQS